MNYLLNLLLYEIIAQKFNMYQNITTSTQRDILFICERGDI